MAHQTWQERALEEQAIGPPEYAMFPPGSVDFVKRTDSAHLQCRLYRHAMEHTSTHTVRSGAWAGISIRQMTCMRCETVRIDVVTPRGTVVKRKYIYPDGYTFKDKDAKGGLDRALTALEVGKRSKKKGLTPTMEDMLKMIMEDK